MTEEQEIEKAIFDLLDQRKAGKTICPSEPARLMQPSDWRPLMEPIRSVAARLFEEGRLEVTQGGRVVRLSDAKGPIRLRLPS